MSLRTELYQIAARHQLDGPALQRLLQLGDLETEPAGLEHWLPRGIAIFAAALGGFGVILWIAANWETFGRFGRFGLLQAFVLATGIGALLRPAGRAPLGLLSLLGIGGLFAYFGQTYQTGADPWQLFALWAALALPLCLALRSDVLWAPWALVVSTGVSLWVHAHIGHRWHFSTEDLPAHTAGWLASLLLVLWLSPLCQRFSGAGVWSLRTAITLCLGTFSFLALCGLFGHDVSLHYWLGLIATLLLAAVSASRQAFDIYGVSLAALSFNTLLVCGISRLLLHNSDSHDILGHLMLIGLVAAGMLAATVTLVLKLYRRHTAEEHAA